MLGKITHLANQHELVKGCWNLFHVTQSCCYEITDDYKVKGEVHQKIKKILTSFTHLHSSSKHTRRSFDEI